METDPYLPAVAGSTIVCVATGPSLSAVEVHALARWPQIAVNDAWWVTPRPVAVFAGDPRWWELNYRAVHTAHPLAMCYTLEYGAPHGVLRLHRSGQTGLDRIRPRLRSGGHSGYAAVNLAFHLLAERPARIILTGYDMQPSVATDGVAGGPPRDHFFGAHPDGSHIRYGQWDALYPELQAALALEGVDLWNATRETALPLPRVTVPALLDTQITV